MTRAHVNAEFKARCADLRTAVRRAREAGARWAGREHQIDTYYRVAEGRLKVREAEGRAELVWYFRRNSLRSKRSEVLLFPLVEPAPVKSALARTLGVLVVVDKLRRIYLRDNVRVHFDRVRGLGDFAEIEAVGGSKGFSGLRRRSEAMAHALGLRRDDLVRGSYSDLVLAKRRRRRRGPVRPSRRRPKDARVLSAVVAGSGAVSSRRYRVTPGGASRKPWLS